VNDYHQPIEYRYRRPDGTVLIHFTALAHESTSLFLSPENQRALEREPEVIADRKYAGGRFWWPFAAIRNGPNGKEWVTLP
jgi:hypothetical protein